MSRKDVWQKLAGLFMLGLVAAMVLYMTYVQVPENNKDIIVAMIGVLTGAAAMGSRSLFENVDGEAEQLRQRVQQLEAKLETSNAELHAIKDQYDRIVAMLVDRHIQPDNPPIPVGRLTAPDRDK